MVKREELYNLVWSQAMTKVADQFGVSGSYMARVCSELRVPRPERGYWAKLAVGKAPKPTPLPEAEPGDPLAWSRDGETNVVHPVRLVTELPNAKKPEVARAAHGTHGLVIQAKRKFEIGYPATEEGYLRPYRSLLVDVTSSKENLDKALSFANRLFNALHSAGHRVVIAPHDQELRRLDVDEREVPPKKQDYPYRRPVWSPARPTVVYIGTVSIGLAVVEMSEEVQMRYINGKYIRDADYVPPKSSRYHDPFTWTTQKEIPCGRLRLVVYSPYRSVSWSRNWQEERKTSSLAKEIPAIVQAIEKSAGELVEMLKEAERQAEIRRKEWEAEKERRRQEEDRRQIQQSIQDSHGQLKQIIQAWGEVTYVERFLQGVQERASDLPDEERAAVLERLSLARDFLGSQDPLDFFRSWKTPLERYTPLSVRSEQRKTAGSGDSD